MSSQSTSSTDEPVRRATTTFQGDTGLWYVPTGEILADKKWSVSFYWTNQDREAGFSDDLSAPSANCALDAAASPIT